MPGNLGTLRARNVQHATACVCEDKPRPHKTLVPKFPWTRDSYGPARSNDDLPSELQAEHRLETFELVAKSNFW